MGTKYDVPRHRKLAIDRLHDLFPSSLNRLLPSLWARWHDTHAFADCRRNHLALPIALARECDVPEILTSCIFRITALTGAEAQKNVSQFSASWEEEDGRIYTMSPQDITTALICGWRLADRYREILVRCLLINVCAGACRAEINETLFDGVELPVPGYDDNLEPYFENKGMCSSCAFDAATVWHKEMYKTVQEFPSYCGLPPWTN
jgi:hypothetical protein